MARALCRHQHVTKLVLLEAKPICTPNPPDLREHDLYQTREKDDSDPLPLLFTPAVNKKGRSGGAAD